MLVKDGILIPCRSSQWASPVVVVKKMARYDCV